VSVGVISTLPNPTLAQVEDLAREAQRAGADWLGVPDARSGGATRGCSPRPRCAPRRR
jgi:hypothetical protein